MPVTSPPMGSNVPPTPEPGTPLSDSRALEEYFRAHFSELATEARSQLDDAGSSAPRVVEGAFRHAWEERQRFHTPQDLEVFLHEEVRHGAAREKSRRASLHRYDGHGVAHGASHGSATADVDQSWNHLARALHFTPEADTAAQQEVAEHLRHDTAGHVAELAKKRSWKVPIAIFVVAAAVVAGGIWYVDRLGDEGAITGALASPDARPHVAATAQLAIVTLDDGTRVELTPESKLIVPKQFGEVMRAVKLDGEATFTVTSGRRRPFEVRAGNNTKVIVTGTVLTIRSFSSESTVVVFLKEGSANVSRVGSDDSARVVGAGRGVVILRSGGMREPSAPELQEATSWNEHTLTIVNRPLRDALPQLRRWYGTDIKVLDLPLLDRPVTIHASLDSPKEAITAVEQSANVKFGYEDKTMVFRDSKSASNK